MTKSTNLHRNHKLRTPESRLCELEQRYARGEELFQEGDPDWRENMVLGESEEDEE